MSTLLTRQFDHELEMRGDGRTVTGLVVPFDHPAPVGDLATGEVYQEVFVRGAFADTAVKVPNKVSFKFTHSDHPDAIVGWGDRLEERDDGLYGDFRLTSYDAPRMRELLEHSHRGLSVEFYPVKSRRRDRDTVIRTRVKLMAVAAVPEPAYATAGVLSVRSDDHDEPELPPDTPNLAAVEEYLASLEQKG